MRENLQETKQRMVLVKRVKITVSYVITRLKLCNTFKQNEKIFSFQKKGIEFNKKQENKEYL